MREIGGVKVPLVFPGLYISNDDKPYEYESAYYLGFQIRSQLRLMPP